MKKAQIITCLVLLTVLAFVYAVSWIDYQQWTISERARIDRDNESILLTIAANEIQAAEQDSMTIEQCEQYINARDLANCEYGIGADFEVIADFEKEF